MISKPNDSPKVLFFSYWYPNIFKTNKAIFVKRHAQALAKVYETEVLAIHVYKNASLLKIKYQLEIDENELKTHHVYIGSFAYKLIYVLLPLQYLIIRFYIRKKIKATFHFNVIHSNVIFPCAIVGDWLSSKYNCKHIITEHWSKVDKFFRVSLYQSFARKALNKAQAITCVSSQLQNTLQKYHQNQKSFIVPNVVNVASFFYDEKIEKFPKFTFTAVAHWHYPKNPFYFLQALKQLLEEGLLTDFNLVLVGKGVILDEIIKQQYPYNIETIDNLSAHELMIHLNKSHVFLHGSDYETFSVVIVEALMCGIPVIVSPVGIAVEVINQDNGYIALNEVSDWKDKILNASQNEYSPVKISKSIGNKYSEMEVANKFKEVYTKSGI
jgi:glycosyltransferase involved in cell wall biosynthesis